MLVLVMFICEISRKQDLWHGLPLQFAYSLYMKLINIPVVH